MFFDRLCSIAEAHWPQILPVLKKAALFHLPYRSVDILPKEIDIEIARTLHTEFFLPFPVVALEDAESVVVLWDSMEKQRGFDSPRLFVELAQSRETVAGYPPGIAEVRAGKIISIHAQSPKKYLTKGELGMGLLADKDKAYAWFSPTNTSPEFWMAATKEAVTNAQAAIEEVMFLNTPNRFILEATPRKPRRGFTENGRVTRSLDRPIYTLLTPGEIKHKLSMPAGGSVCGIAKAPHRRRRHLHTFRDERFTHMKGKTIVIEAVWVGPSEADVGNKHYRVRLDL